MTEDAAATPSTEESAEVKDMLERLTKIKKKKKKKPQVDDTSSKVATNGLADQPAEESTNGANGYSYKLLLDRMYAQLTENNPDLINKKRAVLRPPEVMRVGTSKILWANFPEICNMMKRDPEHVFRFFLAELGTTGSIDASGRFTIKGKYVPKYIESLLKKYIAEYVTCSMCRGVQTNLVRDNVSRMYFMHCASCGATKTVTAIKAGYHATGRGERKAARANA